MIKFGITNTNAQLGHNPQNLNIQHFCIDGVCLLTGEKTPTMGRKMPMMVKGVPGSMAYGAAISSFDKVAYQSEVLNVKKSLIKIAKNMLNFGRRIKIF
ncbi:hypothetical protein RI030_10395 [Aphanizomenon flos-aquae NRERC-008]|uniref:hypothetical protein n=1 Tax=Aphanizomenon flos-aquae TaxID=1176 RepID=UPI00287D1A2B|nr:hypothetical protein [Aphanizomenon flos-aquae]MDS9397996.1 hypothetical protein [Aphanizomenon flos-aquae NRERC-008]